MARTQPQEPALSTGNIIYLYGLLARELGCGKQTFLPRVEEALDAEQMSAADLGFESTRALLETMGDCINLTVFKGGRIYATVIAQPAWDEALAAPTDSKPDATAKGGRPWKRKKTDKSLKPVKPRRLKRAVAEPVVMAEPEIEPEPVTVCEPEPEAITAPEPEPETAPKSESAEPEPAPEPVMPEPEPTTPETLQPSISLTVTYDPYSDNAEETTLEASPVPENLVPALATEAAPAAPAPSPKALAGYPRDFAAEVYCPVDLIAELGRLLPLGTAPMPLLAEDFQRALDLGLVSGGRSRATFPLRVQHATSINPIEVTIRKQSGPGLPWALARVE